MPRQIDVWTVSNFTFVLLSFKLLHSTTEVPFTVLAIYSLRSGTLKRVNGDATRAVCSLRIDVSEALYAILCDKRRSFAYSLDLLCSVIRFVGRTMCVASSTSMIIWCDHCLLVALWFRFHIELATCLLFGFRSLYWDTDRLRMRRATSDEPHAYLVYHFVVVWVVWNNLWFLVWLFAIAVMSSRWR